MKKIIALFLAVAMCLFFVACANDNKSKVNESNKDESSVLNKDEMLSIAKALTREEISKSISNNAFAKSLIGNTYTFCGEIFAVKEDYAVVTFYITDEEGSYATVANVMVANLYLPLNELVTLEHKQRFSFVGQLDDVSTHNENLPDFGTQTVTDMVFKNVAIVSDRFEKTGTLHSKNASYGENAWNIKFPNNDYLGVVHFRDDVSNFKGQEITYSYKITSEGSVDAYIVE